MAPSISAARICRLLPQGCVVPVGIAVLLYHRDAFAEAGVTAETPLEELAQTIVMIAAPDEAETTEAPLESITLENGTPAVRITMASPTEALVMHVADMGDGVIPFAPQILALDYENAELEAQVEAIINSVDVTATEEEVMAVMMSRMGAME